MTAKVRYVTARDGVLTYERWIPKKLRLDGGQRSFRRSLGSNIPSIALAQYAAAEKEYDDLISKRRGVPIAAAIVPAAAILRAKRPVTDKDLHMIESAQRRIERGLHEKMYLWASGSPDHAAALEDEMERYEHDAADRYHAIVTLGFEDISKPWLPSPLADARVVVEQLGLDAPVGSMAFGAVVAAIRRGYLAGAHDVSETLAGRRIPSISFEPDQEITATTPTITEAMETYIIEKKLPPKTVMECRLGLRTFINLVGDKHLDALVRGDFVALVKYLAAKTVGGNSADSVRRAIAPGTVKKRLGLLRSAINHAIDQDLFLGVNPALNIKVDAYVSKPDKAIMPDKRPFNVGEINRILRHPWFVGCRSRKSSHVIGAYRLDGAEYWAPILALFSGCRASELGGLRLAEVLLDGPHPHLRIRDNEYRTTKKGYARNVPIIDQLVEQGFLEYVERVRATGADRLFPDWQSPKRTGNFRADDAAWSNGRIIRSFNRTVVPRMLKDTLIADARLEVTFHSFRGSFKSMLGLSRHRLPPNVIHEVIGHQKWELDNGYVGEIALEETYPAVRHCRYEGLIIPSAP
jgi:integrase